ncbi:MAG: Maf family protein [Burkholderiales bacterium]|nr:Maf family protein [Burkholderiales bacterium]
MAHDTPPLPQRTVVLGSTSPYRRELMTRLRIAFEVCAPDVDETPTPREAPRELALRLSLAKARAVAAQFPKAVVFQTAVSVVCLESGFERSDLSAVKVQFRDLTDAEIEAYLRAEEPYDCAGSAKSEGLGIALLASIDNDDPTALVGLPLIRTCQLLRAAGVVLL